MKFNNGDYIEVIGCPSCVIRSIKVTSKFIKGFDELGRKLTISKKTKHYQVAPWSNTYKSIDNRPRKKFKNK